MPELAHGKGTLSFSTDICYRCVCTSWKMYLLIGIIIYACVYRAQHGNAGMETLQMQIGRDHAHWSILFLLQNSIFFKTASSVVKDCTCTCKVFKPHLCVWLSFQAQVFFRSNLPKPSSFLFMALLLPVAILLATPSSTKLPPWLWIPPLPWAKTTVQN